MTAQEFTRIVEEVFRPRAGRGFAKAAQQVLNISKAQFHRYANGTTPVPGRIADRLCVLRLGKRPDFPAAGVVLRLVASAVVDLGRLRDDQAGESPAGSPEGGASRSDKVIYPRSLQRVLHLMAAARLTLPGGTDLPDTLKDLLGAGLRPAAAWLGAFGPLDQEDTDVVLLEPDGRPTAEALSLSAASRGDVFEGHCFERLLLFCETNSSDPARLYRAVRCFVIENPVVDDLGARLDADRVLGLVPSARALLRGFYRPLHASRIGRVHVPVCRFSRVPLARRLGGGFETECPTPEAQDAARSGIADDFEAGPDTLLLDYALRLSWLYPGLHEIGMADRLARAGYAVELWPELDLYDLDVSGRGLPRPLAIDVKDRRSPGRLAVDFDATKLDRVARHRRVVVAVPDHRVAADPHYLAVFRNLRRSRRLEAVDIETIGGLLRELGA